MKKILLISFLALPALLMAQSTKQPTATNTHASEVAKIKQDVVLKGDDGVVTSPVVRNMKRKAQPFDFVQIGQTYYDLQSNNTLGNRIILHNDGSVSAVWTTSPDNNSTTFPNRGSGYNHFNGTSWGATINTRLEESIRTGWPSLGLLGNGNMYVLAHDATNGGFAFSTKPVGSGTWNTTATILDDSTVFGVERAPIWAKTASSGDNLYVMCSYTNSGINTEDVFANGVQNPNIFSRSTDNGATWTDRNILLPGYDSTLYRFGSAEIYDISAKDSVVAIVMGGIFHPVYIWKSTDYGVTFTMTEVDDFTYQGVNIDQWGFNDTLITNDGSLEIILDNDNNAHVFYGSSRTWQEPNGNDTSLFYIPGSISIMHWTEGMAGPEFCAGALDRNGDGQYSITQETTTFLIDGQIPDNVATVARYGNQTVATFPTASVAANGDIFLIYSLAIEETFSFLNANYRDVMVTYSTDNGANWELSQNVTQDDFNEHVFAFAAERADDNLHIMWQVDEIPGTNLQNNYDQASNHYVTDNKIMYTAIPLSSIKNGELGPHTTGVSDVNNAELFFVGQSYPNPNNGTAEVSVFLLNGADVNIEITDMYGKTVNSGSLGFLNAGDNVLNLNTSELASGMYFYTVSTSEHSMTRKMQVK